MIKDIIIAIDGHSGCGKSTTSKLVAEHFKYNYLDSGAMYRSVALYLLRKNINYLEIEKIREEINNIKIEFKYVDGIQNTFLNDENVEDDQGRYVLDQPYSLKSNDEFARKLRNRQIK